jgi:hypothetical protein
MAALNRALETAGCCPLAGHRFGRWGNGYPSLGSGLNGKGWASRVRRDKALGHRESELLIGAAGALPSRFRPVALAVLLAACRELGLPEPPIESGVQLSYLATIMGTSVVQIEDTYARWLQRTDEQLRAAFDANDLRSGSSSGV